MWSHRYWYYNIRSDSDYSKELPSAHIVAILEKTGVLKRTGAQTFTNEEGFPWIEVCSIASKKGSYSYGPETVTENSNQIAVVASKSDPENESKYVQLLTGIAAELGWELVLETDDDENEDVVLHPKEA